MKVKSFQIRNIIFWVMVAIFVMLVAVIFTGLGRLWGPKLPPSAMIYFGYVFPALGAALVALTVKVKEPGIRKLFFILTGISAAGIPICAVLHNLVYALCVKFNCIYWKGSDEPVFFILAIFVFPALFFIGSLGSIVLLISAKLRKKELSFSIYWAFSIWNRLLKWALKKKAG